MTEPSTSPMDNPDDKDWTWVLETLCPECEYDVREFDRTQIGSMIRANAAEWQAVLAGAEDSLRPWTHTWCPSSAS